MKAKLEQIIRNAVPESMEHAIKCWGENRMGHGILLCRHCGEEEKDECSGRPLNLQDVLIALQPYWNNTKGKLYLTNVSDALYFEKEAGDHLARYDLTKDFHNQKPELYEFLSTLLNE